MDLYIYIKIKIDERIIGNGWIKIISRVNASKREDSLKKDKRDMFENISKLLPHVVTATSSE